MIDERLERKNTQPVRLRVTLGLACLRTKCGQLNHNHWYINGYEPFSNPVLSFYVSFSSVKLSEHGEPRMLLNQRSRLFLLPFAFVGLRIISVNFDYGWVPLGSR